MKLLRACGFLAWAFFAAVVAAQDRPALIIESLAPDGQLHYDLKTGAATSTNGVMVQYGEAVMTAQEVTVNEKTGEVLARGEVRLQHGALIWRAAEIRYNFQTREIQTDQFRMGHSPLLAKGEAAERDPAQGTNAIYLARNAFVTTDNSSDPNYRIKAKKLRIVPGQYVEAHHAVLYVGNIPVFYFPYYHRNLVRHPNHWELTPGYRSLYGPYLLSSYHWAISTNWEAALNLDYRQKRGAGVGPDISYDFGPRAQGLFRYYFTPDDDPGEDPSGRRIRDDRSRIYFAHQTTIDTNLNAKLVLRKQSDPYVVRDFFEHEYRTNIFPSSFLEVNRAWPNFSLDVLAQPQINDFFETVERLPDLKLSVLRQQLGVSPLYYEGENSVGYFRRRFASPNTNDYSAVRADSFHQLLLPYTFFGWLNFTPRLGQRITYYGEADEIGTEERTRAVFNTGAELSMKASRIWRGARNKWLQVDQLRHIVEPSLNYVYVPRPTARPPELPQFDYELQSYRLLPIVFPDYNSIDSIDSQNVLRLSLRNKLQTKRPEGIDNVVNWALYTDWRLKPRPDQGSFADLFSDLDFKPRSWITFNSELRFDLTAGTWRQANHRLTLLPNNVWTLELGHRYLRDDFEVYGAGNNLFTSSLYYRFNENWATRLSHHFEARDGKLEEQYYTIYRDLRSWTAALTFRIREGRRGPTDFGVAITFSLKAFPRFKLGDDRERPSLLIGG